MPRSAKTTSPLDAHLGFWMRFMSNHVSIRFAKLLLDEYGIGVAEWVALRVLYDNPDTTHAALIQTLGVTKGAASKIVSRLESKGLAERRPATHSAREQALQLTSAGRQLVPKLARCADENDNHFFGHLPAAQRQALLVAIRDLVRHHKLQQIPLV